MEHQDIEISGLEEIETLNTASNIIVNGEELTEIIFNENDDIAPDDESDTSSVWSDADNGNEEVFDDEGMGISDEFNEVVDMSVCSFNGHTDSVYCAAISKNRNIITGGGDDKAYIWSYNTETKSVKEPIFELEGHTDTVTSVGFNFDGTLALTGSYDGTIRIWNVATGDMKMVLEGPEDIEWAQWHSKGNAVIAGSQDGTIWMWLAHDGQCVQVFAGHEGGVNCGTFTSDGKTICTGGEDGTIRLWGPKNGQSKHVFSGFHGHSGMVTCISSSESDADLLVTGSVDGTMKLFQISGKRVLQSFQHSKPSSLAPPALNERMDEGDEDKDDEVVLAVECVGLSNGNLKYVASGGMDKFLKIWDLVSGTCRSACEHGDAVVNLRWHASLPLVTTAALDKMVRVWDARGGSLLLELSGHTNIITNLELMSIPSELIIGDKNDPNTETDIIVSVSDDQTAKVFHINAKSLLS